MADPVNGGKKLETKKHTNCFPCQTLRILEALGTIWYVEIAALEQESSEPSQPFREIHHFTLHQKPDQRGSHTPATINKEMRVNHA